MAAQTATEPKDLLRTAQELFGQGRLAESEAAFRLLAQDTLLRAEASYGLGMVRLKRGDYPGAEMLFAEVLERNPLHANALYQMGFLAEGRRDLDAAREWYGLTLQQNPAHTGARKHLAQLEPVHVTPQPPVSPRPEPHPIGTEPSSVFDVLLSDSSEASTRARALLRQLRMDRRSPPVTAYLGGFLFWVVLLVLVMALTTVIPMPAPNVRSWLQSGVIGVAALMLVLNYVRVKTIRISIDEGRLQVEEGLLARQIRSIELWRVTKFDVKQSMLNRLTGDGTLVFTVYGEPRPFQVTGMARHGELLQLRDHLRELVLLLRTNRAMQGIVT